MTKKDYIRIAAAIHSGKPLPGGETVHPGGRATAYSVFYQIAEAMADSLAAENPRFNRARFLDACGTTDGGRLARFLEGGGAS